MARDIKGKFPIRQYPPTRMYPKNLINSAAYILHDTRTITRRQVIRSLKGEEARIFLAKLSHGPGNALTYLSFTRGEKYKTDPSDIRRAFEAFDLSYKLGSMEILSYIDRNKKIISDKGCLTFESALNLLSWYELLVAVVFKFNPSILGKFLKKLSRIDNSPTKALWKII